MQRKTVAALDIVALSLATLGAINWGLNGAANFNPVRRLFGRGSTLERAVYILVGLAGLDLAWLTARYITGGRQTPPPMPPVAPRMMREAGHQAQHTSENVRQGAQRSMSSSIYR